MISNLIKPKCLRHEDKYICSYKQLKYFKSIFEKVLPYDNFQKGDFYHIRSLYFDTDTDRFLNESLNGEKNRKKYRLRFYNYRPSIVKLECKAAIQNLKSKKFIVLSQKQAIDIIEKENFNSNFQMQEFYLLKKTENLSPKIIIDYDRSAFVDNNLNVRVTIDTNIEASVDRDNFFEKACKEKKFLFEKHGLLEIKYDHILPQYVWDILKSENLEKSSFSKYVQGRLLF